MSSLASTELTIQTTVLTSVLRPEELLRTLRKAYITDQRCIKHTGFILDIVEVVKAVPIRISMYSGKCIVDATILAKVFLPVKGDELTGVLTKVLTRHNRLVLTTQGCLQTIVSPLGDMAGYTEGTRIRYVVTEVRFQTGKYVASGDEICGK